MLKFMIAYYEDHRIQKCFATDHHIIIFIFNTFSGGKIYVRFLNRFVNSKFLDILKLSTCFSSDFVFLFKMFAAAVVFHRSLFQVNMIHFFLLRLAREIRACFFKLTPKIRVKTFAAQYQME